MARKVFFSFHYERDAWRASNVRNYDQIADEDEYGVIDAAAWEEVKRQGNDAVKRWINSQLQSTSVTVVLIGAETADRYWVQHEISESWNRGNGVLGVKIHGIRDSRQMTDTPGANPFERVTFPNGSSLASHCKIYDWVADDGRSNLGKWVEAAAQARGK